MFFCKLELPDEGINVVSTIPKCILGTINFEMQSSMCEKCIKNTAWLRYPKVLLIVTSRASFKDFELVKIEKAISIPKYFNFGLNVFNLNSVISHLGNSCIDGHYTSDIKRDDTWYHTSDSKVTKMSETEVMQNNMSTSTIVVYESSA